MQMARFWECDKGKKRGMSLDSDEGFFSQAASLFMLYKIKVE